MEERQFTGRSLRFNHSSALPRYILAIDTETLPHQCDRSGRLFSHQFRLGVGVYGRIQDDRIVGRKIVRYSTTQELWDHVHSLSKANYTLWLVCHNSLFDMVVADMPGEFERAGLVVDWPRSTRSQRENSTQAPIRRSLVCIESPPTIIAARSTRSNGRIVIVDTLNWFQSPLSELGRAIGKPKLHMPEFRHDDQKWYVYCQRDAEIVFDTFVELCLWNKANNMGMFRYTGPSQAMAAYRHRHLTHKVYIHDNLPVKTVERAAYYGGRFEVFRHGEIRETVHQYDVNALFPSVMVHGRFPVCLETYSLPRTYSSELPDINYGNSVAEVELRSCHKDYPKRIGKGVIFPVGEYRTVLCGVELLSAFRAGAIKKIRAYSTYRTEPIFTQWVESLWKMRQDYKSSGNKLYAQFAKMLMNSLYGKFAQRAPEWVTVSNDASMLPWMSWVEYDKLAGTKTNYRSFGWDVQKQLDRNIRHSPDDIIESWVDHAENCGQGELDSTFVAISAFVTAAARMQMNYLRRVAGRRNVFYQGVDSLIVNDQGRARLSVAGELHDTELGKLRHQLSTNTGEILGCSDYRLGDKLIVAGKPRALTVEEQREGLCHRFNVAGNLFHGNGTREVTEELIEWKRQQGYWKGSVQPDGWVKPLLLSGS